VNFLRDYKKASKVENYLEKVKLNFEPEWFENQTASWNMIYEAIFTESLTRRGYGFTFNMLPEQEMFTDL
jgi:hypothetical protein